MRCIWQVPRPVGAVHDALDVAIASALVTDPQTAAKFGASFTWDNAADQFLDALNFARMEVAQAA